MGSVLGTAGCSDSLLSKHNVSNVCMYVCTRSLHVLTWFDMPRLVLLQEGKDVFSYNQRPVRVRQRSE